jgi:hypothetical protein
MTPSSRPRPGSTYSTVRTKEPVPQRASLSDIQTFWHDELQTEQYEGHGYRAEILGTEHRAVPALWWELGPYLDWKENCPTGKSCSLSETLAVRGSWYTRDLSEINSPLFEPVKECKRSDRLQGIFPVQHNLHSSVVVTNHP